MSDYYKQDRKIDLTQSRLINDLAKILTKRIKSTDGCPMQTLIEIGITEFFFDRGVEFSTYEGPIKKGDSHEPVANSGTSGEQ